MHSGDRLRALKAGSVYFVLIFGAGFALGPIRILLLEPRIGVRLAELAEMPVMLMITFFAARWVVRRFALPPALTPRLAVGTVALALMTVAELTLVLWLRGLSIPQYLAQRDPVSGAAYVVALGLVALMPALVRRA
jgi:hypothetical protein